jgi:hypothetical protein
VGEELLVVVSVPRYDSAKLYHQYHRQLFGEDEDAIGELDEAEKKGENGAFSGCLIKDLYVIRTK